MKSIKVIVVSSLMLLGSLVAHAGARADQSGPDDAGKVPVSTGPYITGGVLASTVGFGIGHAVQGRWHDKGWIFTATEAAGTVLVGIGASGCTTSTNSYGSNTTNCPNAGTAVVGLGVLIGFHVWEIVDAWAGARPVEDDNSPKAFFTPDAKSPAAGLAWSF